MQQEPNPLNINRVQMDPKNYLRRLPMLNQALESYESTNPDIVVLYPIFEAYPVNESHLAYRMNAMQWSIRALQLNSDLMEQNVAVKIYIDEATLEQEGIVQYLQNSQFTDNDIVIFGTKEFAAVNPAPEKIMMGKQLFAWVDPRFDSYKYRVILDYDMFLCRTPHGETLGKFPLFEHIGQLSQEHLHAPEIINMGISTDAVPRPHWKRGIANSDANWFECVKQFVKSNATMEDLQQMYDMRGWAWVIPNAYFEKRDDFKRFIDNTAAVFHSDECIVGLWERLFARGDLKPYFSDMGLPYTYDDEAIHEFHRSTEIGFYVAHLLPDWHLKFFNHIGYGKGEIRTKSAGEMYPQLVAGQPATEEGE